MVSDRDQRHVRYDYWRYAGRDWRSYQLILDRLHPVPPILEVGSGLGFFLECCRHNGIPAVGLELSEEGVASCRVKGLTVVRGDLTTPFPFRDESFGSALAHHVFEHVPREKMRHALHEIRRVLKRGGHLFVVSPNICNPASRDDEDHVNLFTPHELGREARRAGYRRVSLGTNYYRPLNGRRFLFGGISVLLSGALWKVAPLDRFAGSASCMARR